jgi:hypothetical protein
MTHSRAYRFVRRLGIKTGMKGDFVKYMALRGRLSICTISGILMLNFRRRDLETGKLQMYGLPIPPEKWHSIKIIPKAR